jgi:hypothetical protein
MLRDDVLLRMIERLAEAVAAYLRGEASADEVEQQIQATTGMPLSAIDLLPPSAIVPPVDDPEVRRAKALALADALEALGRREKAEAVRRLVRPG